MSAARTNDKDIDVFAEYGRKPADLAKAVNFWRRAELRWQDWAKRLLADPPDGMWGDDMSRELLRLELLAYRRGNGRLPLTLLERHEKIGARNISRRLARAVKRDHVKRQGKWL